MTKIPSKLIRRQALWEVHGMKCFYCDRILFFRDCEVDHIISQGLRKRPDELRRRLKYYGLPEHFDINGLSNQVPCHSMCNKKKGDKQYSKGAINFYIEQASQKAKRVEELENTYREILEKDYRDGRRAMIQEHRLLSKSDLRYLARSDRLSQLAPPDETLVISFSLNVHELFESDSLPGEAPREYPHLCDWLGEDLLEQLTHTVSTPFHPVEDSRDGESFSVRVVFFRLNEGELQRFSARWWEVLPEGRFSEVYGQAPGNYFGKSGP